MQEFRIRNRAIVFVRSVPWNEDYITLQQIQRLTFHNNSQLPIQNLERRMARIARYPNRRIGRYTINCDSRQGEVTSRLSWRDKWLNDLVPIASCRVQIFWSIILGYEVRGICISCQGIGTGVPGRVCRCSTVDCVGTRTVIRLCVNVEASERGNDFCTRA
jgi:hypothetical protein